MPAGRAGLRGVGVQDVGPPRADEPAQLRGSRARRRGATARAAARADAGTARRARRRRAPSTPRPAGSCPRRRARRGRARCCPAASSSTDSAAPPTFSRAITCTIFMPRASLPAGRSPGRASASSSATSGCRRTALAGERADERRRATASGHVVERRAGGVARVRDASRSPADVPSSEQEERRADQAELVEHLVVRLLRDERAGRPAGSSAAGCRGTRAARRARYRANVARRQLARTSRCRRADGARKTRPPT